MMNLDLWVTFLQDQDIAKNLKNNQFAKNLKNGSDIYEHVHLSKVYTRRTNDEAVCLAVLFFLMYYLGIPIVFRKCAAIWVNLFPQEEECISSYWRDSKIYTSGSVANSQGMLTEINESGAIAKIRVWVESNAIKHLKVFRIISC